MPSPPSGIVMSGVAPSKMVTVPVEAILRVDCGDTTTFAEIGYVCCVLLIVKLMTGGATASMTLAVGWRVVDSIDSG